METGEALVSHPSQLPARPDNLKTFDLNVNVFTFLQMYLLLHLREFHAKCMKQKRLQLLLKKFSDCET
jgi:hypothetical protein